MKCSTCGDMQRVQVEKGDWEDCPDCHPRFKLGAPALPPRAPPLVRQSSKAWMAELMEKVFSECRELRGAGQAEYAHRDENAFANFERVAERRGISREAVLLVYMEKHLDGISSWVDGHRSQRESVKGRINDSIVYLCLLRGMVETNELL